MAWVFMRLEGSGVGILGKFLGWEEKRLKASRGLFSKEGMLGRLVPLGSRWDYEWIY